MRAAAADGCSVLPRARKTRGILAVLAFAAPRPVLRDELTALLWSQRDREQARASLRQAVHELQEHLLPVGDTLLIADRNHISLARAGIWIDVQAVARATATAPEPLSLLLDADPPGSLLRDLIGVDPAFDRWIENERQRITRGAVGVAEAVLAGQTDSADVIAAAEQVLALEVTHEAAWRALMVAHARSGDRAGAIAAFGRCSAALAEVAQVEPTAETRALLAAIRSDTGLVPGTSPFLTTPAQTGERAGPAGAFVRSGDQADLPVPENGPGRGPANPERRPAPQTAHEPGVRLGVLPFRLLDRDGDAALSVGLAEEITTALSRFRYISLIASPTLAAIDRGSLSESGRDDLRALALDFLVDGTVQRGAGRVRVIVRLLDMSAHGAGRAGAEVIWARRFDRDASDFLTLQDEIAAETVAQIDPELLLREGRRASNLKLRDGSAYDLLLCAIPSVYRLDEASFRAAGDMLAAAVALEPEFAAAHAWWAYWHVFLVGQGWASDPVAAMLRAGELAERAILLDPSDARAITIAGHVRAFLHRRIDEALALHERAISLNPNLPLAWVLSGLAHVYAGRHEEAVRRIGEARRLSPFDPHAFFFDMALTIPQYLLGNFGSVVELSRAVIAMNPTLSSTYKGHLAALGQLAYQGDRDAAAELVTVRARLLALEPGFCVQSALARSPLQRTADRAAYAEGLRRAGLRDGPGGDAASQPPWLDVSVLPLVRTTEVI